jgi:hypothetical protein
MCGRSRSRVISTYVPEQAARICALIPPSPLAPPARGQTERQRSCAFGCAARMRRVSGTPARTAPRVSQSGRRLCRVRQPRRRVSSASARVPSRQLERRLSRGRLRRPFCRAFGANSRRGRRNHESGRRPRTRRSPSHRRKRLHTQLSASSPQSATMTAVCGSARIWMPTRRGAACAPTSRRVLRPSRGMQLPQPARHTTAWRRFDPCGHVARPQRTRLVGRPSGSALALCVSRSARANDPNQGSIRSTSPVPIEVP